MAFRVEKNLEIKTRPFQRGVDILILEKVSQLLGRSDIEWVNYKEVKPTKPFTRKFHIFNACNLRDK